MSNDAIQLVRTTCYVCGRDLDEYLPKEDHHIDLRGMGGSKARDVGPNKVRLCPDCHRLRHAEQLQIYKNDGGLIIVKRLVDGHWRNQIPYGQLRTGAEVAKDIYATESFGTFLTKLQGQLGLWCDEALKEQYGVNEAAGTMIFASQCLIIHTLSERRSISNGQENKKLGLKEAARFLGIKYQTAKLRHAVWMEIFANLPTGTAYWNGLSAEYFYKAYRAKGKGIDPVEALDYAEERALSNASYSPSAFQRDLNLGLPAATNGESTLPGCPYQCQNFHYAGSDAVMRIYIHGKMVAEGAADGQRYCAYKKKLIGDLDTAEPCEGFKRR